jgi:MinD-like ATPase involved in chromosome partitioning or flagellar assembly
MTPMRVATLAAEPEHEARTASWLSARSDCELVLRCMDRVDLLAAIRGGGLDAVVAIGVPTWLDRQCVQEIAQRGVAMVGLVGSSNGAERLIDFGGTVLAQGAPPDDVLAACRGTPPAPIRQLHSSQPSGRRGRMIVCWGPKGSPGRTRIAIELASELSMTEPSTLLVDGDTYGGDVLQLLGMTEELATLVWATRLASKDELDASRLVTELRRAGATGPVVVPGIPRAELWPEVSHFGWQQLVTAARAAFRVTVCDVGFCLEPDGSAYAPASDGRNRLSRHAIDAADHVVAVFRADPVGIKNFLWSFDDLRSVVDRDRIIAVANRVAPGTESEIAEIVRRHTGKRPLAYVPDSPAEVGAAVSRGIAVRDVKPGSDFTSAVRTLAAAVGGEPRPQGFLTRLAGRR